MNSLLRDPLITTRMDDGSVETLSLPGLYVALGEDRVTDFPALRPHQRHAWHAFLTQLAALALDRTVAEALPTSATQWEARLRTLTPDHPDDAPWSLIVDDPSEPAFMQCPAPAGLDEYRRQVHAPDDLDLLVTAKNHDVKQTVATDNAPDDWVFALVDLQTMAGFLGAGNYGVARMNGGFSSRPCLGLAPATGGIGAHVLHDIRRMVAGRQDTLAESAPYFRPQGGTALVWLEPWDGKESLDLRGLDPFFIEVCRRVRLAEQDGEIVARTAPSKKPRIQAKAANGVLGDFWTPIDKKDNKALSVGASGFTYKRLCELLFDASTFRQPRAMRVDGSSDDRWVVVARAVANGQGKTDGYHERTDVRFSRRVAGLFAKAGRERDHLADLARSQIEEVDAVTKALRFGVATAASGGKAPSEISKADRVHATPFVRRLEGEADAFFFTALEQRFLAMDEESAQVKRADFTGRLIDIARRLLAEAVETVPCPAIWRHRARAKGVDAFERDLRSPKGVLADLPTPHPKESTDER